MAAPNARIIKRQLFLAAAITALGVTAAARAQRLPGSSRQLLSLAAALLLIAGISWWLVGAVRLWALRDARRPRS